MKELCLFRGERTDGKILEYCGLLFAGLREQLLESLEQRGLQVDEGTGAESFDYGHQSPQATNYSKPLIPLEYLPQ